MGPMGRGRRCPEPLSLWGLKTGTGSGCDQGPAIRPACPLPSEGLSAHVRQAGDRGASAGAGQGGGPLAQQPALPDTCVLVHGPVLCEGPGPGTGCVSRSLSSGRCSLRSCGRPRPAPPPQPAHLPTPGRCCPAAAPGKRVGLSSAFLYERCAAEGRGVSPVTLRAALVQRQLLQPLQMPCA